MIESRFLLNIVYQSSLTRPFSLFSASRDLERLTQEMATYASNRNTIEDAMDVLQEDLDVIKLLNGIKWLIWWIFVLILILVFESWFSLTAPFPKFGLWICWKVTMEFGLDSISKFFASTRSTKSNAVCSPSALPFSFTIYDQEIWWPLMFKIREENGSQCGRTPKIKCWINCWPVHRQWKIRGCPTYRLLSNVPVLLVALILHVRFWLVVHSFLCFKK